MGNAVGGWGDAMTLALGEIGGDGVALALRWATWGGGCPGRGYNREMPWPCEGQQGVFSSPGNLLQPDLERALPGDHL